MHANNQGKTARAALVAFLLGLGAGGCQGAPVDPGNTAASKNNTISIIGQGCIPNLCVDGQCAMGLHCWEGSCLDDACHPTCTDQDGTTQIQEIPDGGEGLTTPCGVTTCTGANCSCNIGGQSYSAGSSNPAFACQVCNPAQSTTSWSNGNANAPCNTGNPCIINGLCGSGANLGTCQGTLNPCNNPPPGTCQAACAASPNCCNTTTGLCNYPLAPVGTNCSTGTVCQTAGQCTATGACQGTAVQCNSPGPCQGACAQTPSSLCCQNPVGCVYPPAANNVACTGGTCNTPGCCDCQNGECVDGNVVFGAGAPSYGPTNVYNTGSGPSWVSAGVLNALGQTDLVVVNSTQGSTSVEVFEGGGNENFPATYTYTPPGAGLLWSDATASFRDNQNLIDVAVTDYVNGSIYVLFNNGSPFGGGFGFNLESTLSLTFPDSIAAIDVNGDGYPDIVSIEEFAGEAVTWLNNGAANPGFNPVPASNLTFLGNAAAEPAQIASGIFNSHFPTQVDFAIPNAGADNVSVLINNGAGSFGANATQYPVPAVITNPQGVAVADFQKQGAWDIEVNGNCDTQITVLPNNGTGTFGTGLDYSILPTAQTCPSQTAPCGWGGTGGPVTSVAADFNGDGWPDLAVLVAGGWFGCALADQAYLCILINQTNSNAPTFGPATCYSTGSGAIGSGQPVGLVVGHFNNAAPPAGGRNDIAVVNYGDTSSQLAIFANTCQL